MLYYGELVLGVLLRRMIATEEKLRWLFFSPSDAERYFFYNITPHSLSLLACTYKKKIKLGTIISLSAC